MKHRYRNLWNAVLCFLVLVTLVSCSPESDSPKDTGEQDETEARFVEEAPSLSKLWVAYADVIRQVPRHPRSEEVANRLLDAATHDGLVEGESAAENLMYEFPEDNFGLYLFEREYARHSEGSSTLADTFLQRVQKQAPDTAIASMAFSESLDRLLRESPEQFLAQCGEMLEDGQTEKAARVALHRRILYYADNGQVKLAGRDALRFWATYPDIVERMHLQIMLTTRLRESGLILEGEILERSENPATLARAFFDEFREVKLADEVAGQRLSFSEAYFRFAPEIFNILAAALPDESHTVEQAFFYARLGRLAISQTDGELSAKRLHSPDEYDFYGKYLEQIDGLIEAEHFDSETAKPMEAVHRASLNVLHKMFGKADFAWKEYAVRYPPGSVQANRFLAQFSTAGVRIASLASENIDGLDSSAYAAIIDEHVRFLQTLNNRKDIPVVYEEFLSRFPSSKEAPAQLMMLAHYYGEVSGAPTMAQQTYARVFEQYPYSPQAETASMKLCLSLYDSEMHEEAFERLQEFQVTYPESDQIVDAQFLSAMCESGMGLSDDAEQHMKDLVREHPQHTIAARAMFWLASASLSRKDYSGAHETFLNLTKRYPESEYATRAREYIERLGAKAW